MSNAPPTGGLVQRLQPTCALLLAGLLAGCTQPIAPDPFAAVTIEQLKTDPASWIGRPVEVEGVVDAAAGDSWRLKENCASTARSVAVRWDMVPGFHASDDGAKVRVRGVFRNDGAIAARGSDEGDNIVKNRGVLENVSIFWRLPPDLPRCHF